MGWIYKRADLSDIASAGNVKLTICWRRRSHDRALRFAGV
jgi:hypothetical protein